MNSRLFACDIDNTLIYSKKHPHAGWRCVEWIHGEEQAYISPGTERMLKTVCDCLTVIPVTSRSMEQYHRLSLPVTFPYAVTANGADLLTDGIPDSLWRQETNALIEPWCSELDRCFQNLKGSNRYIRCRLVDNAYLFVYCRDGVDPATEASYLSAETSLEVISSGKKIYMLPPPLNKGTTLDRIVKRLNVNISFAAGDSLMDLPMLCHADVAIAPDALRKWLVKPAMLCPSDLVFSEYALQVVQDTCQR